MIRQVVQICDKFWDTQYLKILIVDFCDRAEKAITISAIKDYTNIEVSCQKSCSPKKRSKRNKERSETDIQTERLTDRQTNRETEKGAKQKK